MHFSWNRDLYPNPKNLFLILKSLSPNVVSKRREVSGVFENLNFKQQKTQTKVSILAPMTRSLIQRVITWIGTGIIDIQFLSEKTFRSQILRNYTSGGRFNLRQRTVELGCLVLSELGYQKSLFNQDFFHSLGLRFFQRFQVDPKQIFIDFERNYRISFKTIRHINSKKKKDLALNSGIQTNQILTKNDEFCIPRLLVIKQPFFDDWSVTYAFLYIKILVTTTQIISLAFDQIMLESFGIQIPGLLTIN